MVDVGFPKNWSMITHIKEGFARIQMYASLMVVLANIVGQLLKSLLLN